MAALTSAIESRDRKLNPINTEHVEPNLSDFNALYLYCKDYLIVGDYYNVSSNI